MTRLIHTFTETGQAQNQMMKMKMNQGLPRVSHMAVLNLFFLHYHNCFSYSFSLVEYITGKK